MKASETSGARAALLAVSLAGEGCDEAARKSHGVRATIASALFAVALLVALLGAAPGSAQATETVFCAGANVGPKQNCFGPTMTFNATYGTGAQGSVCVGNGVSGSACSGGPGQGVYKAVGEWITTQPWVFNNLPGKSNVVHGIAFTP